MWVYYGTNPQESIYHYGIRGMHWGVRRGGGSSKIKSGRKSKTQKQKDVKSMSDEELRKAVNRMQMERQYQTLSESEVSRGKKYAKKVLAVGTTVAAVTSTALTIYNNAGKISRIISKITP